MQKCDAKVNLLYCYFLSILNDIVHWCKCSKLLNMTINYSKCIIRYETFSQNMKKIIF
jgi:hypothetical protein